MIEMVISLLCIDGIVRNFNCFTGIMVVIISGHVRRVLACECEFLGMQNDYYETCTTLKEKNGAAHHSCINCHLTLCC